MSGLPTPEQAKAERTFADRFADAPHLFDIDMAHFAHDTANEEAPEIVQTEPASDATNLLVPTVIRKTTDRSGERIVANHLGLVGAVPSLPPHYTSAVIRERRRRNSGLGDFLEMFSAELRKLFVDAHRKYRLPSLLQLYRTGERNRVAQSVFSLVGFGDAGRRKNMVIDEELVLFYAGFFADQRRTAVSLERMIADFLGLPVKVIQFSRRQLPVAAEEQTALDGDGNANAILGKTALAGSSCTDRRTSVRVRIGPLNYAQYNALMPDRALYAHLVQLIRLYLGTAIGFDIQLVLAREHVPSTTMTSADPRRLGWGMFALSGKALKDSDETVFDPEIVKPRHAA